MARGGRRGRVCHLLKVKEVFQKVQKVIKMDRLTDGNFAFCIANPFVI